MKENNSSKIKNTLVDLNGYLFEQLERLNDDSLSPEELEREIQRSDAITQISTKVIDNADLVLKAMKYRTEIIPVRDKMPSLLGIEE